MDSSIPPHKSTVYSLKSKILIYKKHFPEIIRRLKLYNSKNETLQKSTALWKAISEYNWNAQFDTSTNNIINLMYRGTNWGANSIRFISIISKFVESGGYIQMVDENNKSYWVYDFDGFKVNRRNLIKKYIDLNDKKELNKLLSDTVTALLKLGTTKTELEKTIKELFVNKLLK